MDQTRHEAYTKLYEQLLSNGEPITKFMVEHKLPATFYRFAKKRGWKPSMRSSLWARATSPLKKRTLQDADIIRLHKAIDPETERPYTLAKIGILAGGVSRQCIEQILSRYGLSSRKTTERIAWRQAQLEQEEQEYQERLEATRILEETRYQELYTLYLPAIKMWNSNKTISEIAIFYNKETNAMSWTLHKLNERYGWFPRRGIEGRQGIYSQESKDALKLRDETAYTEARKMWTQGSTIAEMATAYNKTRDEMSWLIFRLQTKYNWFPRRTAV